VTRIALCLDDVGLHAGVNAAAMALARQGRLSAVSCMVGAPHWTGAKEALAACGAAGADIGLHLDLTEAPLRGARQSLGSLLLRSHARLLAPMALRDEIEAQLDAFEATLQRSPDHVDGHQHVHQLPQVRDALLEALRRRYRSARPWLRSTRHAANLVRPAGQALATALKPWVIEALGAAGLARLAAQHGHRQNGRLLGVYDFGGEVATYRAWLRAWLRAARDGDLLMCHAATEPADGDPIGAARRREWQVFAAPEFPEMLAHAGVELLPISRMGAVR
jgi:predicted glycoside hydrolase/deacetylase ChbG (UPF0249 family)